MKVAKSELSLVRIASFYPCLPIILDVKYLPFGFSCFLFFYVLDLNEEKIVLCNQVVGPYLKKKVIFLYREKVLLSVVIPKLNIVIGRRKIKILILKLEQRSQDT